MPDAQETAPKAGILICEDEVVYAKHIAAVLRDLGYEISATVREGREAIRAVGEARPDLILMDISLPGEIDGVEATAEICARFDVPVVYLTAHSGDAVLERAKHTKPYGYVIKPADSLELKCTIETALVKWQADRKVRKAEERRAKAEELAGLHSWEWDIPTGHLVWSAESYRAFGICPADAELTLDTFINSVHPDDRDLVRSNLQDALEGRRPYDLEFRIVQPDGRERFLHGRGEIRRDGNGQPIRMLGMALDVTDRKELEQERDRILNNSYDLICVAGMDGYFKYVNPSWERVLGYTKEELLAKPFLDVIHPEDHDKNHEEVRKLQSGQATVDFENRYIHKNGSVRIISWTATPLPEKGVMYCIGRDVTDQKRVAQQLKGQVLFMESLLEAIPAPVFYKSTDHIYLGCNQAFCLFLGLPKEEIIGRSVDEISSKQIAEGYREKDEELFERPGIQVYEALVESSDGSPRRVLFHKASFIRSDGQVAGIIGFILDITERKQAEEALRSRERLLDKIYEILPVGLWVADGTGRLVRSNPVGRQIWGADQLVGPEEYGIFKARRWPTGEEITAADWSLVQTISQGVSVSDELLEKDTFDGKKRIVLNYTAPVFDESGKVDAAVVVNLDVTQRIRAEEALRESEARLRLAQDAATAGTWEWDLRTDENIWSEEVWPLYGVEPHSCHPSYESWRRLVHPDDRAMAELAVQQAASSASELNTEWRVNHPEGEERWLMSRGRPVRDAEGRPTRFIGIVMDITDQKRAELALKASEQKYRRLFDNSPLGIISVDTDGRILEINQALLDILGSPSKEATKAINMFTLPELVKSGMSEAFRSSMTTSDRVVKEVPYVSRWGKPSYLRAVLTPTMDQDGIICGCQAIVEDITQQKRLEEKLLQSHKMKAIGTLAGGISHDFNNLLQIISGHAELLELELARRNTRFSEMDAIRQAAQRGVDLVKQILTFSRKVESRFESIDLNDDLKVTERLLYRTIPKIIEMELKLEEKLRPVLADSSHIEQMLVNLAVNAKDAMPDGGKLTFETQNVNLDEDYCRSVSGIMPGRYVLIKVSDTGHGMKREVMDHIFDPFFTTKSVGDGTGLGLSTVFGIVRMHEGHITCESDPGQGTTFNIYFPAASETVAPHSAKQSPLPVMTEGTETILVVDDEPLIADLAKKILGKAGYTVVSAGSGKEALEIFEREQSHISLVILDLIMPEMGGKQCLEELIKIEPTVKALIASGTSVQSQKRGLLDAGARGVVSKPFDISEMLRSVRHVLDGV